MVMKRLIKTAEQHYHTWLQILNEVITGTSNVAVSEELAVGVLGNAGLWISRAKLPSILPVELLTLPSEFKRILTRMMYCAAMRFSLSSYRLFEEPYGHELRPLADYVAEFDKHAAGLIIAEALIKDEKYNGALLSALSVAQTSMAKKTAQELMGKARPQMKTIRPINDPEGLLRSALSPYSGNTISGGGGRGE